MRWHEVLSKALWAHRISRHGATKVTPFELVYGQEAVLPVEVNLDAYRLAKQNDLSVLISGRLSRGESKVGELLNDLLEENPRRWHEVLSEALWAYRIS